MAPSRITEEQRRLYNENRRLKRQAETPEERKARLSRRNKTEQARRESYTADDLVRVALSKTNYVARQLQLDPLYHSKRFKKESKNRSEKYIKAMDSLLGELLNTHFVCPACAEITPNERRGVTVFGAPSKVCGSCLLKQRGVRDISSDSFWRAYTGRTNKRVFARMERHKRRGVYAREYIAVSWEFLKSLWESQHKLCALCQIKLTSSNLSIDHIVPLARGGSHVEKNLQFLCDKCNRSKFLDISV